MTLSRIIRIGSRITRRGISMGNCPEEKTSRTMEQKLEDVAQESRAEDNRAILWDGTLMMSFRISRKVNRAGSWGGPFSRLRSRGRLNGGLISVYIVGRMSL